MKPTQYQINLFKKLSPILGVAPKVFSFGDETGKHHIRLLSCPDPTDEKVRFFSTLGLAELAPENHHTEILGACYSDFEYFENIISSIAFFIIKDKWKSAEGSVFETLVEMYYPNTEMKHIYFTSPFLWEDKLEEFSVEGISVRFLLAIPISDKELEFLTQHGKEAFEDLLEENNIDIFNLERKSVV